MVWVLKIVLSVLMAFAGGAKLMGAQPLAEQFDEFGLPIASMYTVGVLEIAAAIGIYFAPLTFYASTGVAILMAGAVANHLLVKHPISKSAPALLVFVLALTHSLLAMSTA